MIAIDGSHGEGGGQIIRAALSLSLATGTPFRIDRIRARRAKPGLRRQHLTGVEAARAVSNAEVAGASLGSTSLTFRPGALVPGAYRFPIGTAGSTLLVVQALLPALLTTGAAWHLALEGGTHNPMAPSWPFFARTLLPVLASIGAPIEARLDRAGFYPQGGGQIAVTIPAGARLGPLELLDRGEIRGRDVTALVARLPRHIAERELATATARLGWDASVGVIDELDARGPGNVVSIAVASSHLTEVFTAHGERGVPAERVALAAADECLAYLAATAPVGEYLADQLLVPLALASGGRFATTIVSDHTQTQIDLLRHFLGIEVTTHDRGDGWIELAVPAR